MPGTYVLPSARSFSLTLVAVVCCSALIACGGGGSSSPNPSPTPTPSVTVTVSPSSTNLVVGATQQFSATVTGSANTTVTWSVAGVPGGNTTVGTISSNGLYTAPANVPNPAAVSISATSSADVSKSATATVNVKLLIAMSPSSAAVQVFHRQQFTASVSGVSDTGITWSINGIANGNPTVGQIDTTGLYVAPNAVPSPSAITVTATSHADATQSASAQLTVLTDASAPTILTVSPTPGESDLPLNSTVQIQFSDALDPSSVNSSTFQVGAGPIPLPTAVSYDSSRNTVTLAPLGLLTPGTQYTVTVANTVADPAGMTLTASSAWSFTTQSTSTTAGQVLTPNATDPTTLTVVSYGGQKTVPDSSGNFTASVTPFGTNLVAAMIPGKAFGWLAFAGNLSSATNATATAKARVMLSREAPLSQSSRSVSFTNFQITSTPAASVSSSTISIDAITTAEALVFMTPYFFTSDPLKAAVIQATIAADPNIQPLADALAAAQTDSDPLKNAGVQSALQQAALSILKTLSTSAQTAIRTNGVKRAASVRSLASSSGSSQLHPLFTPNCWAGPPGTLNSLQCLDLQYLELDSNITPDSSGNFNVSVNNCWFAHQQPYDFGCSTNWLLEVAPITNPPAGGVNSVVSVGGSNGQSASPTQIFDPGCTLAQPSSSCRFFWVPGASAFGDAGVILSSFVENALGISQYAPTALQSGPTTVPIPSTVTQDYIVRAYSGGFADLTEYSNIIAGAYNTDSLAMVANALAMNAMQDVLHYTTAFIPGDSSTKQKILSCVVSNAINNHDVFNEVSAIQASLRTTSSTPQSLQTLYEVTANNFVNVSLKYEVSCAASIVTDPIEGFFSGLNYEIHLFLNDPASALATNLDLAIQGIASQASGTATDLGEGTQGLIELIRSATPVETAIISVAPPSQLGPQITGLSPSQIVGVDGPQPITILGLGFQNGALIQWQDITGGGTGTVIPSSVTATSISASMNFTSQPGTWKIQILNPGGTSSNFWQFQVSVPTTPRPDLLPKAVTLSSTSASGGGIVTVTFTVANQGAGSAGQSTTGFRLGASNTVHPDPSGDIPQSTITTPALAPGQALTQSQTLTIPSSIPTGTYYVWVVVDDVVNSTLGQSNTLNDYAASPPLSVTGSSTTGPVPLSPGAPTDTGYQVNTTTPTMQWSGSGGAQFELAISQYPYGTSNIVYDNSSIPASSTSIVIPAGYLQSGTSYRWNMRAVGSNTWSNQLYFTVNTTSSSTGTANVTPRSWSPVFTAGGAAATIGFYITNQSTGTLTGTISASTTSGGQWLTVNGHPSDSWVAPATEEVTANPAGLAAGTYSGTVTVSTAANSITVPVTMTIYNALQITTGSLPDAVSGQPYSLQLQASGGTGTGYTWTLVSGVLPVGISFSPAGLLSGTAGSISGSTTETLRFAVQDSLGHQVLTTLTLIWRQALVVLPYSPSNFQFVVGTPYNSGNSITFQAAGGTPPYTWSATGLPAGLSIGSSSGLISGTPTQSGNFSAVITVHDSAGSSNSQTFTLPVVISPLAITGPTGQTPPVLAAGTVGTAYNQFLDGQGGSQSPSGNTWSIQGSLPPGLTTQTPSGCTAPCLQIIGTPTQGGSYTFSVKLVDSLGDTATASVTIVINTGTPPSISSTSPLPAAVVGQSYTYTFSATGGSGSGYVWSLVGNSPDPGLQLSAAGVFSGTPTVPNDCTGTWTQNPTTFQVKVTDSSGQSSGPKLFCLTASYPDPQISLVSPSSVIADGQNHTVTVNGTNFHSNSAVMLNNQPLPTTYVNGGQLTFALSPATSLCSGVFVSGTACLGESNYRLQVLQPFANLSNTATFSIYDPVPTISNATAVLNNSNQPCTHGLSCQLVINGSGFVWVSTYSVAGQSVGRCAVPSTPLPWNTVTTCAFSVPSAGTYTVTVSNPNQPGGGTATATGTFTVN